MSSVYFTLFVGNNNVMEVRGLTNSATGIVDNSATVNCTKIVDSDGTTVTGQTWPKEMTYVSGSTGKYRATLDATIAVTANRVYTAHIDVAGSGGEVAHWEAEVRAKTRAAVIRTA